MSRQKLQATASVDGHRSNVSPAPACAERSAEVEELDESAVAALIGFFKMLDKWDLEAKQNGKVM